MVQHHNYNITDLENMIPWEREIYIGMLANWLEEEEKRQKEEEAKQRRSR